MVPWPSRATASRDRCASRSASGSGSPVIATSTSWTDMPTSASRRQPPTIHPTPSDSANTSASASSSADQFIVSSITIPLPIQQVVSGPVAGQSLARTRQPGGILQASTGLRRWPPPAQPKRWAWEYSALSWRFTGKHARQRVGTPGNVVATSASAPPNSDQAETGGGYLGITRLAQSHKPAQRQPHGRNQNCAYVSRSSHPR